MADIGGNTRRTTDIVEAQLRDKGVGLEQERERLADTSSGTENGNLGVPRGGRGELARLEGAASS